MSTVWKILHPADIDPAIPQDRNYLETVPDPGKTILACDLRRRRELRHRQPPGVGNWAPDELEVVATIIDVGVAKGVPRWGWVVGIAAAKRVRLSESVSRDSQFAGARLIP